MAPLLLLAFAGGAAGIGYCYYRGARARHEKLNTKQDLKRWEDEGGNVPEVDTPTPQVRPQTSHPLASPGARH
jgi:hypothetical protein